MLALSRRGRIGVKRVKLGEVLGQADQKQGSFGGQERRAWMMGGWQCGPFSSSSRFCFLWLGLNCWNQFELYEELHPCSNVLPTCVSCFINDTGGEIK